MASATCQLSEQQFQCCICLEVFTQPTSLPCGHSFCKHCIERWWADNVLYKCPYCKQIFPSKPELKVNVFMSEMASQFKQTINKHKVESIAKPGEIPCGVCPEPKLKAKKSCLVCLTSYCHTHLNPHLTVTGLKRHELVEPQKNLEEKLHPKHVFSQQESLLLGKTRVDLEEIIHAKQMKIQELRHSVEMSNTDADKEITQGIKVFTALKEAVDKGLENFFQEINRKQTAINDQAKDMIKELEREISELQRRCCEMDQLLRLDSLLQPQSFSQLRSTPRTKDWTNISLHSPTYKGTVARALSELEQEFNQTTTDLLEAALKKIKQFQTIVTLDGDTAHPQLVVSQNGEQVNYSIEQRLMRNSPDRFDDIFVLGRQSFSKTFYFEVEVKGKTEWTLGVATESVNRKGTLTLSPQNGFWTIGLRNNSYFASASSETPLRTKSKPEHVGVFVDFDEGRVSFYDVKAAALIYSFSGFTFKERLYPICSPGRYSYGNFSPLIVSHNYVQSRIKWPVKWPTIR